MTALMIQGCGSNVGKSMLVAGLCRAALRRGLTVAPFKPQNMSNNAAVTVDGGEIGRAQALQALACGLEPLTDMNPVLLKPETDVGSQVIVQGRRVATVRARDYAAMKPALMGAVLDSFARLRAAYDLVIVEGAGSPAEVNLRPGDIANMGFARAADVPVVLVGDIDRGGVIAQIVGTQVVIDAGVPEVVLPVVKSQKPVTLTTAMVQKGISQNKGRFQKCFKENKPELPAAQGTLKVTFAIASTGRVSSVSTDLEGTSVSKCIQSAVKGMTFPRHVDLEVRVPIALNWDVR